jgi:1,2-phenylacetyl-CoA epoxidase catalytic subunit
MIFDFISGEASTQEGGEKFAKWLAEDADLTQKEKKSVIEKIKDFFANLLDSTPEHTVRDEYAQEVLDTLRGMAITLSDEQKAETAYHHDRYGNGLLFLYFATKSTATPKAFCFLLLFV